MSTLLFIAAYPFTHCTDRKRTCQLWDSVSGASEKPRVLDSLPCAFYHSGTMEPYIHKVQYYETDRMQITHHSNYIRFMEEARVDFLEKIGWGYDKMEAEGIMSPVVSLSCDYKKTTSFPDRISIAVTVKKCTAVKLTLGYTMSVGSTVVCTASSVHCFINAEGHPLVIEKVFPAFYRDLKALEDEAGL